MIKSHVAAMKISMLKHVIPETVHKMSMVVAASEDQLMSFLMFDDRMGDEQVGSLEQGAVEKETHE